MSDLEREVVQRMKSQQQQDLELVRAEELEKLRLQDREAFLASRALILGQEVVKLLVKYNAPTDTVWEANVVAYKETTSIMHGSRPLHAYSNAGRGWHIYTHRAGDPNNTYDYPISDRHVGISDSGKVFNFDNTTNVSRLEMQNPKQKVLGLVAPSYAHDVKTIAEIEGEWFREGLASILRGLGPRVIRTKNSWDKPSDHKT